MSCCGGGGYGDRERMTRSLGSLLRRLWEFVGKTQVKQFEKLIELHGGDQAAAMRAFAIRVANEIDARGVLDVLRYGVKDRGVLVDLCYFRPGHTLAADALKEYDANVLSVARQLHFSARDAAQSVDLAFFVNGLPVASVELKNPMTGQDADHAVAQYRRRDPNELFFAKRTLVHFAVDPDRAFITTRLSGGDTEFLPFNVGSAGAGNSGGAGNPASVRDDYSVSYLWENIWQRDNWLEILQRYLHVQTAGPKDNPHAAPRIFPRYHQWDAVQRMVADAREHGAGQDYLVEHSAGSGKSNTIAWLAHRLSTLFSDANEQVFHKVIVITDRTVLDRQLQRTIYQFDHTPGVVMRIDEDSAQLAAALEDSTSKIVISTLQKFPYVLDKIAGTELGGKRYAVIVDEAHSSQGGDAAARLRQAIGADNEGRPDETPLEYLGRMRRKQPNLSYFAFTATPTSRTLNLFGRYDPTRPNPDKPGETGMNVPFHVYSMRQAIEEGYILDVLANYITYDVKWRLRNLAVEQQESLSANPEVDERKAKRELVRFAVRHPTSVDQRAKLIVDDFRDNVARRLGGRAKAMVVTSQPRGRARHVPGDADVRGRPRLRDAGGVLRVARADARGHGHRGAAQRVSRGAAAEDVRLHAGRRPALRDERQARVSAACRRGEIPDRVRPAAAVRDVRGQAADRGRRGADAVPAEPDPPAQVAGRRAGT